MVKCCDINAGMLREPISIQRPTKVSDGAGGYTETWAAPSGSPTRAGVKASGGSERWASERTEAVATWKFTMRYWSGLLESDRIVMRSIAYNITHIDNVEFADRWMVVTATRGVAT